MGFEKQKETQVESLDITVQEFKHESGLRHIHLSCSDTELGFSVGFRTPPDSDNGRAHVLEHLSLGGSENYQGKNPFFSMSSRTLSSFMNAMTYPDRTIYPFNTPNRKDFDNLLGIYLDATFFPLLRELDFRQEGWRYEVSKDEQGERVLEIQGVVYNEMKGSFDNPARTQYKALMGAVRPNTSYEKESGGDPKSIPDLTLEKLKKFHHDHYHPSRAVIVTYGNIEAAEIQAKLETLVISKFKGEVLPPLAHERVDRSQKIAPRIVTFQAGEATGEYSYYAQWLRHESTDHFSSLIDQFMVSAAFTSEAAPLRQKLSDLGYGQPGDFSFVIDDTAETSITLGVSGLEEVEVSSARTAFWKAVKEVGEEGVSQEMLEASICEFETQIRNTESDEPFGFGLISQAMTQALNDGVVVDALDMQKMLDKVRPLLTVESLKKWVKELAAQPFVEVNMVPDPNWLEDRRVFEKNFLESKSQTLKEADWVEIEKLQNSVYKHQSRISDIDSLPSIASSDIERNPEEKPAVQWHQSSSLALHHHIPAASRGIGELVLLLDTSSLSREEWILASMWAALATQMGAGDLSWQENAQQLSRDGQQINASYSILNDISNPQALRTAMVIGGQNLEEHGCRLGEGLVRILSQTRWDDVERLSFMVQSYLKEMQANPSQMIPADLGRGMTVGSDFKAFIHGPLSLPYWVELQEKLKHNPMGVVAEFKSFQEKLQTFPILVKSVGGPNIAKAGDFLQKALGTVLSFDPTKPSDYGYTRETLDFSNRGWSANQQVGRMFQIFEAPPQDHPDYPVLQVLGKIISSDFLHSAIREKGGAYGAGVSTSALIVLSSYRDPRVGGTFEDFEKAISWAQNGEFKNNSINGGILSVIQSADSPETPRSKANSGWGLVARNITTEMRKKTREGVLDVTHSRLQDVAQKWFSGPSSKMASLPENKVLEAEKIGMEVVSVLPLKTKKPKLN